MWGLCNLAVVLLTVLFMEIFSWFVHKYLFHGPLWFIHKTHHERTLHSSLELNDIFSGIFATISFCLIYHGWFAPAPISLSIGTGIALYGMIYFVIHDGLIHQRYASWSKTTNAYLKQVQRAHQRHHTFPHKTPSEEFGLFLIIGGNYWRAVFGK